MCLRPGQSGAAALAVGIHTAVEGVHRLFARRECPAPNRLDLWCGWPWLRTLLAFAVLATARDANFNMRAAFLRCSMTPLGSLGVIVAAIVIWLTGFTRRMPLRVCLFIAGADCAAQYV